MATAGKFQTPLVDDALRMLGVRRFALAVHDQSFPSLPDEDVGRGSPYSQGGLAFLRFARRLGFNTIQLGPQGKTSRKDPSPYNGAIFSRSILSLAARTLASDSRLSGLLPPSEADRLISSAQWRARRAGTARVDQAAAWETADELLEAVYQRFRGVGHSGGAAVSGVSSEFEAFVAAQKSAPVDWFRRDCVFEALSAAADDDDWRVWGTQGGGLLPIDQRLFLPQSDEEDLCRRRVRQVLQNHQSTVERFAFGQFLLHLQHERMREEARSLGLSLLADMHIGFSHQDQWAWRSLFLPNYLLGAPPSRTTRQGQPWAYPVLHPHKLFTLGPRAEIAAGEALKFVQARVQKLLAECDGIRIDHPQGLVCPWVYRADDPDPFHAVCHGARLNSSPNFPDHPELAAFSLVRPDQLHPDPGYPRYGDDQVVEMSPEQVERYAVALDAILDCAKSAGRDPDDILCEVLSTWPAPLKAVMQRRGMGRFCVTQKADPANPRDVYRPENTSPNDWIMVGNHDTKPLWLVVDERKATGWMRDRATLLAQRLVTEPGDREAFVASLAADPRQFCEAMFADLFVGPAQNVSVFFTDLLGGKEPYNEPGTFGERNWTLRVPNDYETLYVDLASRGEAFNIHRSLALALETRSSVLGDQARSLAARLRGVTGP